MVKLKNNLKFDPIFLLVFRESLVNRERLVVLVTVDLLDLLGHLDSLDLLESLAERSEHSSNSQPHIHIHHNGHDPSNKLGEFMFSSEYCVYFLGNSWIRWTSG